MSNQAGARRPAQHCVTPLACTYVPPRTCVRSAAPCPEGTRGLWATRPSDPAGPAASAAAFPQTGAGRRVPHRIVGQAAAAGIAAGRGSRGGKCLPPPKKKRNEENSPTYQKHTSTEVNILFLSLPHLNFFLRKSRLVKSGVLFSGAFKAV